MVQGRERGKVCRGAVQNLGRESEVENKKIRETEETRWRWD